MIAMLLMLADVPAMTAVDAERAFAADAKSIGQWTAFRKWSTDDATMFVPQPINAHEFLKPLKDPPRVIDWWPTASFVSCDGKIAVNTGGWQRPDGKVGYFSTVWQRQPDGGWKWIVDGGGDLKVARPRPAEPVVKVARCLKPMDAAGIIVTRPGATIGRGVADDMSLAWWWTVMPDGAREFRVMLYNGKTLATVLDDKIPAPAK